MIIETLLPFAEDLVNRVLRTDKVTLKRLGDLQDKVICMAYRPAGDQLHAFYLFPSEGGLRIRIRHEGDPHVTITGNLPAFLRMLIGETSTASLAASEMQIKGDMKLGQAFKEIMEQLEPDLEQELSRFLGGTAAHHLARIGRSWWRWKTEARRNLEQDFAEYVREEAQATPHAHEINEFVDAVDQLRSDADRLSQRVERLLRGQG